jgi:hypothetical protein
VIETRYSHGCDHAKPRLRLVRTDTQDGMNRRIVFILSFVLVAVHLPLMAVKGSIGGNVEDALFGLLLCLLPALPILLLSIGQVHRRTPKTVTTVAALETVLTLWLFLNVYLIPAASTVAIGLVTVPLFFLVFNGALAAAAYVLIRRRNGE